MASLVAGVCLAPSFARAQAPPATLPPDGARVVRMSGRVSVLRDAYAWALQVGEAVKCKEIIETGPDGYATFEVVSDHSTFDVFPGSRVVFRTNPGNWKDLLDVMIGRIKVHIERIGGVPNPNRVVTPTAIISVRGTTFDVSVEDDGWSTLVVVDEGHVEVRHALLPQGLAKQLFDGDYIRVYKNVPIAEKAFDSGGAIRKALRVAVDVMLQWPRGAGSPGGGGTSIPSGGGTAGGGTVGDTKTDPPPPPPPPPPAAPPPG
ncbi:MAG: FecR family protein [Acidobacteria bacterium]|nr:FecR family protein [Acidobacteriota bacterium]